VSFHDDGNLHINGNSVTRWHVYKSGSNNSLHEFYYILCPFFDGGRVVEIQSLQDLKNCLSVTSEVVQGVGTPIRIVTNFGNRRRRQHIHIKITSEQMIDTFED
jgi:hypothetical protein